MRTEVYVKADIENILKALNQSIESLPPNDYPEDLYRLGFVSALRSVALAFGIEPISEYEGGLHRLRIAERSNENVATY